MTPTPNLEPKILEAIAHNLCSLHDFDPAFVARLEPFSRAVITEYLRAARPAPTDDKLRVAVEALEPFALASERPVTRGVRRESYVPADHEELAHGITWGHLRAAFSALAALQAPGEAGDGLTVTLVESPGAFGGLAIRKWDNHGLTAGTHRLYLRPPADQAAAVALRHERLHHVAELMQGSEDPNGEKFQTLAAWALSPRMIAPADRPLVIAFFAGREQAAIDEGHDDDGTDADAIAQRLVARLEGST